MVTIVFEPHATSLDNEAGLSSGHYDVKLSELGKKQAQQLGRRYASESFNAIFCSDLQRGYKTAEIAFGERDFNILQDKRLREIDYGNLTRCSKAELDAVNSQHVVNPFPGGQSYEQTTEMMKKFLSGVLRDYDNKKIMIIGSRATQYGLEKIINKVPLIQSINAPWQWQPGWEYKLKSL